MSNLKRLTDVKGVSFELFELSEWVGRRVISCIGIVIYDLKGPFKSAYIGLKYD